jgi:hypothetical protein
MSLGFGPKIHLRGAMPKYSDLLFGVVSHFDFICISSVSMGMCSCLALFEFMFLFANMST